jgi:hypothetical protein
MRMVGLMRVLKGSSPSRTIAQLMLQLEIRSTNTAISGTTGGPRTVSTRAQAGDGAGADVATGVAADTGATRVAGGAAALTGLMFSIPSPPPNNVGNFLSVLPTVFFSSLVRCSNS